MCLRGFFRWALPVFAAPLAFCSHPKSCVPVDEATHLLNQDVCVAAHVYDVVEMANGTRFLDVCSPGTPDEKCRFTVVSPREDRDTVGDLSSYRDTDVQIRGTVRATYGRVGMLLSHSRQFHGGAPRFRPDPRLARGFDGTEDSPPLPDPNLHHQGRARSFMNSQERESRLSK